jgi:hypothetical protein
MYDYNNDGRPDLSLSITSPPHQEKLKSIPVEPAITNHTVEQLPVTAIRLDRGCIN